MSSRRGRDYISLALYLLTWPSLNPLHWISIHDFFNLIIHCVRVLLAGFWELPCETTMLQHWKCCWYKSLQNRIAALLTALNISYLLLRDISGFQLEKKLAKLCWRSWVLGLSNLALLKCLLFLLYSIEM